jgi:pyruvate,water dikinase
MESVEPVRSIVRLAEQLRGDGELRARIESLVDPPAPAPAAVREGLEALADEARFSAFSSGLRQHLERFGDRCFEELKLESQSFRSDPRPLLRMVLGYADGDIRGDLMLEREHAIREAAERSLAQALAGRPLKRKLVRFVLSQARRSIKLRESSRLDRARAFDIPRAIFRQLGENLAREGALSRPDDVFFLTADEVFSYVQGTSVDAQLYWLVERRRVLDKQHRERRPAERVVTHGTVYGNRIPQRLPAAPAAEGEAGGIVLEGLGCAPGVVTGEAVVVRNPASAGDVRGKVLVAEMTDPGWVFLMISAAGLVAERGSVLSHTAIIGRELGIVTVVGVEGATERIPDGARLQLDGDAGTVRVLDVLDLRDADDHPGNGRDGPC